MDPLAMSRLSGDPESAWYSLSWNTRRRVMKYAGKGQRHPDRGVSEIAERWAVYRLRPGRWRERREEGIAFLVLSIIMPDGAGGSLGMLLAERRAARRILKAIAAADKGNQDSRLD
jgi:hypothetical protein